MDNLIIVIIILALWIGSYVLITKNNNIKHRIKTYLRQHFSDSNDVIWAKTVSALYICLPYFMLIFVDITKLSQYVSFDLDAFILGFIGFIATLSITSMFLDICIAIWQFSYDDMNDVGWIKQVLKINPIVSVLAAVSEEFFQRLLIPIMIYMVSNNETYLVYALVITSLIFIFFQVYYVDTKIQKIVQLTASISISLVSIILFIYTKNVVPSVIMHSCYVIFFIKEKGR